jgi:hypothetical protein
MKSLKGLATSAVILLSPFLFLLPLVLVESVPMLARRCLS